MWRLLALVLLLANGAYFAWGSGWLLPYGFGPAPQDEPQRLSQQMQPEAVKILSAKEFQRIEEQVKAEREFKECLQAGPFDARQTATLQQYLGDLLPAGSWQFDETEVPERWIIYMGKYPNAAALAKKRAEVLALNLKPENLQNPALEPGFSLGAFESKAEADAALARLSGRGLRSAKVTLEQPGSVLSQLRLPAVGAALKPMLAGLSSALGENSLRACN